MNETWPDRSFRCPTCDSAFPELVGCLDLADGHCTDRWHEPEPRTVEQWRSEVLRWAGILEQFKFAKNPVDAASRVAADMRREVAAAPPEPNHGPLPDGGFWAGFCERCDTLGCPGDCDV